MVNKYRSTKMSNSLYEWHDLFSQNIFYLCVCLLQSINNNEILIHFETVRYPKHMVLWSYWHNGAIIYIASSGREVEKRKQQNMSQIQSMYAYKINVRTYFCILERFNNIERWKVFDLYFFFEYCTQWRMTRYTYTTKYTNTWWDGWTPNENL